MNSNYDDTNYSDLLSNNVNMTACEMLFYIQKDIDEIKHTVDISHAENNDQELYEVKKENRRLKV